MLLGPSDLTFEQYLVSNNLLAKIGRSRRDFGLIFAKSLLVQLMYINIEIHASIQSISKVITN